MQCYSFLSSPFSLSLFLENLGAVWERVWNFVFHKFKFFCLKLLFLKNKKYYFNIFVREINF